MNFTYINKLSTIKYPNIHKNYNFIICFKNNTFLKKNTIDTINYILKKNTTFNYKILKNIFISISKKPLGSRLGCGKGALSLNKNFYKKYSILLESNINNFKMYKSIIKDISYKFKGKIFILKNKKC